MFGIYAVYSYGVLKKGNKLSCIHLDSSTRNEETKRVHFHIVALHLLELELFIELISLFV